MSSVALKKQRTYDQKRRRSGEDNFGECRVQLPEGTDPHEVEYDKEAHAAKDDKRACSQVEQDIVPIWYEVLQPAQYVKTGIVERSHRVEYASPYGAAQGGNPVKMK